MRIVALVLAGSAIAASAQAQPVRLWRVETPKDAPAVLAYAQPANPEDLGLSFSCPRGSGQITVRTLATRRLADHLNGTIWIDGAGLPAPWPVSVTFTAGEAATTLRGLANAEEKSGGSVVATEISTAAPVIKAFRKTGTLKVEALGETLEPLPATRGMVRQFLGACK